MKRSEALTSLSRDHHAALYVALTLSRADDATRAGTAFLEFWNHDGRDHFRVEEEVMLPIWATYGDVDQAGVSRMLGDHLAIRRAALLIESGKASLPDMHELGDRINAHVRFEERELFPLIESCLTPPQLDHLAGAIADAEAAD